MNIDIVLSDIMPQVSGLGLRVEGLGFGVSGSGLSPRPPICGLRCGFRAFWGFGVLGFWGFRFRARQHIASRCVVARRQLQS